MIYCFLATNVPLHWRGLGREKSTGELQSGQCVAVPWQAAPPATVAGLELALMNLLLETTRSLGPVSAG